MAPAWVDGSWGVLYLSWDDLLSDLGWVAREDLELSHGLRSQAISDLLNRWDEIVEYVARGIPEDALDGFSRRLLAVLATPIVSEAASKLESLSASGPEELPDLVRDILMRDIQHRLRRIVDIPEWRMPGKAAVLGKIRLLLNTRTPNPDDCLLQVAAILHLPEYL